jgi:hypothetical protein
VRATTAVRDGLAHETICPPDLRPDLDSSFMHLRNLALDLACLRGHLRNMASSRHEPPLSQRAADELTAGTAAVAAAVGLAVWASRASLRVARGTSGVMIGSGATASVSLRAWLGAHPLRVGGVAMCAVVVNAAVRHAISRWRCKHGGGDDSAHMSAAVDDNCADVEAADGFATPKRESERARLAMTPDDDALMYDDNCKGYEHAIVVLGFLRETEPPYRMNLGRGGNAAITYREVGPTEFLSLRIQRAAEQ